MKYEMCFLFYHEAKQKQMADVKSTKCCESHIGRDKESERLLTALLLTRFKIFLDVL